VRDVLGGERTKTRHDPRGSIGPGARCDGAQENGVLRAAAKTGEREGGGGSPADVHTDGDGRRGVSAGDGAEDESPLSELLRPGRPPEHGSGRRVADRDESRPCRQVVHADLHGRAKPAGRFELDSKLATEAGHERRAVLGRLALPEDGRAPASRRRSGENGQCSAERGQERPPSSTCRTPEHRFDPCLF
jgi:hypothetical protein